MDKRDFDDAIGEVPPSTVDVDGVIRRGRRADRVRRVANPAVAAGVAVVLLTGAVAYTMTRDDGGPAVGSAPPPSTAASTPPSSKTAPPTTQPGVTSYDIPITPPPQCDGDLADAGEVAARLRQATTDAVLAQRPNLQLSSNNDYPEGTPRGPLEFYQTITRGEDEVSICDREGDFESTAMTTAPEGAGNLLVLVGPDFHPGEPPTCERNGLPGMTSCEAVTGPDGEKIVKQAVGFEGGVVMHRVEVVREDGTSVLVQAENVGTSSKYGTPATASAPPLTLDQLVAVGTDPDLTLFP